MVEYRTDTGNCPLLSMVRGQYTKSTSSFINVRVVKVLVLVTLDCVVVVAVVGVVVEVSVCVVDVSDLVVEVIVEVAVMVVSVCVVDVSDLVVEVLVEVAVIVVDDDVTVVIVVTIGPMSRMLAFDSRISQCFADTGTMYSSSLYSSYEIPSIGIASTSVPTRACRSIDCLLIWASLFGVSAALPVKTSSRLASSGSRLVENRMMTVNPMLSAIYCGRHRTAICSGIRLAVLVVVVALTLVVVEIVVVEVERGRISRILFDDTRLSQRMSATGTM